MPVRIYDIAKKLGIENKEVLAKAKELGIGGARVASSSLDKITAEFLEGHFTHFRPVVAEPSPAPPPAPEPIILVTRPPEPEPEPLPAAASALPEPPEAIAPSHSVPETQTPAPGVAGPAELEPLEATASTEPAAPELAPLPEPPLPPPGPKVGDKVGFIQLPAKPAPRVPEKPAAPRFPVRPGVPAGRNDFQRGRPDARGFRSPQFPTRPGLNQPRPGVGGAGRGPESAPAVTEPRFVPPQTGEVITLKPPIIVRDLAEQIKRKPYQLIADLIELKVLANVNQAIDETVAQMLCAKYGFRFEVEKRDKRMGIVHAPVREVELDVEDRSEDMLPRPPVVTIMGHVDHGKTSLLDVIRKANVAGGEAGGITQHIGAYTISFPHPERKNDHQQITFLDTPGHAAFSAMRARGANVTDIVVLVVAANDGVMPQTIEALSHAQAAKVPILVAVNKCDHPNANPMKVRQQLQERGLVPDDWGGDTIFVDVSALTKQGIDKLLEMILLQADLLELKANFDRRAKGNVIESGLAPGGPTATVLVRKGTLRVSDVVICGQYWGRVRALINEEDKRLKEAGPSVAVKMLGLNGVPEAGLEFSAVEDEKSARLLGEQRAQEAKEMNNESRSKVTLETLFDTLATSSVKTLKVVVKADAQGSVEAIVEALKKLESEKVTLEVIHSAVGTITESDVLLASASKGIILGFHTRIDNSVSDVAKREGVQIKLYSIIYELVDQVKEAMAGLLDPVIKEVTIGAAEVRKLFALSKGGNVAGCVVGMGRLVRGKARIMRRKSLIYEGVIQSLRRFQDEVNEVRAGMECGIRIDGFDEFQLGDSIECFSIEKVPGKF